MKTILWHTEKRRLKDLLPADYNPRKISDDQKEKLKQSLENFGYVETIDINLDNTIIGGHQRLNALADLGYDEIDVRVPNRQLTKREEQTLNISLNKIMGEFDNEMLALIDRHVLEDGGFESDELDEIFYEEKPEPNVTEDAPPDIEEVETKVKSGDIWKLGRHKLMCADCTVKENVELLMDSKKADMVFCDPPYGMFLDTDFSSMQGLGGGNKYDKVTGDNDDFKPELITKIFEYFDYCKELFMWGADYYAELIPKRNDGCFIVWDKMGSENAPNDDYNKMFGSNFELCWSKTKHKRAIARVLWKGIFGLSKEDTKERVHPTQKPVLLVNWFLEKFSEKNNIIVDVFLGSGSTLITCEQTDRICYGMEIEPRYCDVIIARWENFTKLKAVKIEA